jgi:hypothetical protein
LVEAEVDVSERRQRAQAVLDTVLRDIWACDELPADDDGDIPFRFGSAACWVSVLTTRPVMVRVFAHGAYDLEPSPALFSELNDIQLATLSASVAWCDGTVLVSQTLSPHGLNRRTLRQAMRAVGGVANDVGPLLAGLFDGQTPYPATVDLGSTP